MNLGINFSAILSPEQQAWMKNAARTRSYELFLGAGASVGAKNIRGPLPGTAELVKKLAEKYGSKAPISESDDILTAYRRAVTAEGESEVYELFRELFADADHQEWFGRATCFPWKRVWTLNIDDAFERSYDAYKSPAHPRLHSVCWDEQIHDDRSALQLVHLHGSVERPEPRPLVFSFREYIGKASGNAAWDQVLAGAYAVSPFVVVGAGIFGDPDVEALFMGPRSPSSVPSFVVSPYIEEARQWDLEQKGLIYIAATAEEFFKEWAEYCDLDKNLEAHFVESSLRLPQLSPRSVRHVQKPPPQHDFFSGDEPLWSDAVAGHIAALEWMKEIEQEIRRWIAEPAPHLIRIIGPRFSGSTSGLYFLMHLAATAGVRSFWFDRSSRFDASDVVMLAQANGPVCIFVESAADYADDINASLSEAGLLGVSGLLFVVTEQQRNALRLEGRLGGPYGQKVVNVRPKLKRGDARILAHNLIEHVRAGEFGLDRNMGRLVDFCVGKDAFSAMLSISGGSGFIDRVRMEFNRLNTWQRDFVLLLQIAAADRNAVGSTEAQFAIGVSAAIIRQAVLEFDALSALAETDGEAFTARQRDKALAATVATLGSDAALESIIRITNNLSPLVQSASLEKRNPPALLVGHLMSVKFLSQLFSLEQIAGFFSAVQVSYGSWNGRYWEQRAIAHKGRGDWSKAESYASRAVALHPSPYTRTTLGTILINRATASARDGVRSDWLDMYSRGRGALEQASRDADERFVARFAYLTAALELLEALRSVEGGAADERYLVVAGDWSQRYAEVRFLIRSGGEDVEATDRSEGLSRRFEALTDPHLNESPFEGLVVGHEYRGVVKQIRGHGILVDCGGARWVLVRYSDQKSASGGLPRSVPKTQVGDVLRLRIVSTSEARSRGLFVRREDGGGS